MKFSQLAETLEIVAQKGADAFYTGKIGQDLIQDIKEAGRSNRHILGWLEAKNSEVSDSCLFL